MTPYKLSPSLGTIKEDMIIGRNEEIVNLLKSLRAQSVTLEEIRRMGKTLLLKKLAYVCNNDLLKEFTEDNFKAVYFSLQGKQNLGEVIDLLIAGLNGLKKWYQIDLTETLGFIHKIGSAIKPSVGGLEFSIKLPEYHRSWKEVFFKLMEDVAKSLKNKHQKLVIILDELPIMLWDWYSAGKQQDVKELLDILRERRQALEQHGLRFVYCGSIGMKVILRTLRRELKYTGEPTNDMLEYNLKPFAEKDAIFQMECFLLSGFIIDGDNKMDIFKEIYELCNGLPFYIAAIFVVLQREFNSVLNGQTVNSAFNLLLDEPSYQNNFNQLVDRITTYYPTTAHLMIPLLTFISRENTDVREDKIRSHFGNERLLIREVLSTLVDDHYLLRTVEDEVRVYRFKYKIFKKWWQINIA